MYSDTLRPGNCPPSPGFAPCAILICSIFALARYSAVTPKRPEATCLILELSEPPSRRRSSAPTRSAPDPFHQGLPRLHRRVTLAVLSSFARVRPPADAV